MHLISYYPTFVENKITNEMKKITLKNLHEATDQEVFDQVSKHLIDQNTHSTTEGGGCAYRGKSGLKCAVGCLIDDDEYDEAFEGAQWLSLSREGQVSSSHCHLISCIQDIHDNFGVFMWREKLSNLAKDFNLTCNF